MDKFWYRNLFSRSPRADLHATRTRADHGDADAQFSLGLKFANSEGGAQDYLQAAGWYLKAADQSHALAQFNLGVMYAQGQGVAQDDAQAVMWIRKAAHQGDAGAQFNLGMRQYRASMEASPDSQVEAYKWFHLAAAQGYKGSAAACESLVLRMTREELADGQQRVAALMAEQPNHPSAQ